MKKRSNVLRSGRSKTLSLSMNDLITHSENTMSSQASVYTNDSKKSQPIFSQISTNSQEFEDYDDIIGEDIDTLFITPQEQKKIQNILQFARKGKINPANAFEIPVRVIDPQITETTNMRFWKFASQLLYASMSIYDKRVQNMYQNTNRMFDNLVRVQGQPNQPLTDQQVEEKQRRQRGDLIRMEVGEVGKTEGVSSYQIGSVNCEEADRINIKSLRHQFLPDPLFGRRLQAFDSNSLKSLFMNAFECGTDTQIVFFNGYPKEEVKEEEIKNEAKQEEQMSDYEERVPKFVSKQIQNSGSLQRIQKINSFQLISQFKKFNVKQSLENTRNQIRDFTNDLQQFNKQIKEMQAGDIFQHLNHTQISETQSMTQAGDGSFNFHFNAPEHTQLSEQIRFQSQTKPLSHAFSSQNASQSPFYTEDIYENNSQMTPWQLQFKGLKLQRRKNIKRTIPEGQPKSKKVRMQSTHELDFLNGVVETRSKIFKITKSRIDQPSQQIEDRYLVPKHMNPFTEAYKQRRMQQRNDFTAFIQAQNQMNKKRHSSQILENLKPQQFQFQPEENNHQESFNLQTITQTTTQNNFQSNLYHEQHQTQGMMYRSSGIRNMREVKQKIYRHIENGQPIRLSSLNINLHPSSLLIIFLHLVNENNLVIESVDNETDIEICLRSS